VRPRVERSVSWWAGRIARVTTYADLAPTAGHVEHPLATGTRHAGHQLFRADWPADDQYWRPGLVRRCECADRRRETLGSGKQNAHCATCGRIFRETDGGASLAPDVCLTVTVFTGQAGDERARTRHTAIAGPAWRAGRIRSDRISTAASARISPVQFTLRWPGRQIGRQTRLVPVAGCLPRWFEDDVRNCTPCRSTKPAVTAACPARCCHPKEKEGRADLGLTPVACRL